MATLKVLLTQILDSGFPSYGVFEFMEFSGQVVVIQEKLLVIGVEEMKGKSRLPVEVDLDCKVISTSNFEALIDISQPYNIEDIKGRTQFTVHADMIVS